jgi:hypothetical protein
MLTYEQSASLMSDMEFRGRIKVAMLKFANSILDESGAVPAHNSRYKWAQQAMSQPDMYAMNLQPPVCMDAAVQDAGKNIDDAGLQGAVESTVNKLI